MYAYEDACKGLAACDIDQPSRSPPSVNRKATNRSVTSSKQSRRLDREPHTPSPAEAHSPSVPAARSSGPQSPYPPAQAGSRDSTRTRRSRQRRCPRCCSVPGSARGYPSGASIAVRSRTGRTIRSTGGGCRSDSAFLNGGDRTVRGEGTGDLRSRCSRSFVRWGWFFCPGFCHTVDTGTSSRDSLRVLRLERGNGLGAWRRVRTCAHGAEAVADTGGPGARHLVLVGLIVAKQVNLVGKPSKAKNKVRIVWRERKIDCG